MRSSAEPKETGDDLAPAGEETSPGDELARLRARVRELEQAPSRDDRADALLSMLSHELRSPVQSLTLNVDACLQRLGAPPSELAWLRDKLTRQRRMAARLKLLIDTFLDIGQITTGQLQFELERVDLGGLVSDVVGRVRDDLTWAHCPCSLETQAGVAGQWDRLQLDLVVSNLMSNAIKYGAGAPISVAVWGTADTGFVQVRDCGPGIARADHGRIFQKFTRLASPSRVGGFGLGLWIVRHIVEAGGGSIQLESEAGQGTSFTVALPRTDQGSPIRR